LLEFLQDDAETSPKTPRAQILAAGVISFTTRKKERYKFNSMRRQRAKGEAFGSQTVSTRSFVLETDKGWCTLGRSVERGYFG
jgi:hypothetical protein